jgi:TolB-like protein
MTIRSAILALVLLAGCAYGFAGGGLPKEIRTVAVMPFDNLTSDPTIAQEANQVVRDAVEQRLGLRNAAEAQADVIVTGSVQRYEPDQPVSYRGTGTTQGRDRAATVEVSKRLLQVTVKIEMLQRSTEKNLLKNTTFRLDQQYDPGNEAVGRRAAMSQLVDDLIEEAQKQW